MGFERFCTSMEAVVTNPDVTQSEEITVWEWIAGVALVAVLVGTFFLSDRNIQVATNEPVVVPPITYPIPTQVPGAN